MIDLENLTGVFKDSYGDEPRLFRAPGRVNLIGEHTDYNDGFVLPMAIDREAVTAISLRDDSVIKIHAVDRGESVEFDLRDKPVKLRGTWLDFVEGTTRILHDKYDFKTGANIAFASSVPIGAGLSSSAAIEIAVGYALLSVNAVEIEKVELALAAQRAEHEYVGANIGIMDQFTSALGTESHALLIDCRTLTARQIKLELTNLSVVVINSGVKHSLAASEYNTRRRECEQAVAILKENLPQIKALRDVGTNDFELYGENLPEPIRSRARHVVTENERTLRAAKELENGNVQVVGELMYASHNSLRDDYEVSCAELDFLVERAGGVPGVAGARMTGGGFGGCTVNLVHYNQVDKLKQTITADYQRQFNLEPQFYVVQASNGASELKQP